MKAGSVGKCPEVDTEDVLPIMVLPENHMLILNVESAYNEMLKAIEDYHEISTVYVVTNSESAYWDMVSGMNVEHTYQLYRDYLDNFRINTEVTR